MSGDVEPATLPKAPFTIGRMATSVDGDPAPFRQAFTRDHALLFEQPFDAPTLQMLIGRAAGASFVEHDVAPFGKREIEAPQRVGSAISMLLGRPAFLQWVEQATGLTPVRAIAGRLAQTRPGGVHEIDWHDDLNDPHRLLGIVLNLSDAPFAGGLFEMRAVGAGQPFLSHHYARPGSMMIFAVNPALEHRVTAVTAGGPRRVYSGWFMTRPEFPKSGV